MRGGEGGGPLRRQGGHRKDPSRRSFRRGARGAALAKRRRIGGCPDGQYDTVHAYDESARSSHAVARWLERKGHRAVAAFIPIDMSPPKHGMKGAVEGNYYYCFACQAACPVGRVSRA